MDFKETTEHAMTNKCKYH